MAFSLQIDSNNHEQLKTLNYNISVPGHETIMVPCMLTQTYATVIENIKELEEKLNLIDIGLSDDIINFYRNIKSSTQEIYIKEWTLFSIDNIYKMLVTNKENNIHVTDFALKYCGMGHCKVAFYDYKTKMIYYRHDGGSNGWDRIERYEALQMYKSDTNNPGLTFDIFLKQINENLEESDCLF